jgi:predicted ATPase
MMSAQPGEIWVDDRIARRVARRFELDFVGAQTFKGFASEQKVYLLRGYTQAFEPLYQGELVGRKAELAQLADFTEPLWQGRFAGLLLISGEAGIGKGRLVHEFRSSTRQKGKRVLWAVCQSNQILRQSFNPLRSWLFRYFGISQNQPVEEQKSAFDSKLNDLLDSISDPELVLELERTRSILGALLSLHWEDSLYEQLDAEGRYNNTFLALIALLKAESLRQPVILFLKDLQFTDKDTKDFLPWLKRAVLAARESYPIAILLTSRPPGFGLARDLIDVRIDLRAITPEAVAHLLEIRLGGPAAPDLIDFVVERSEGNPYFAEQILLYLQDENLIETGEAGWRLVREIEEGVLPGDIRSVLVARLDQLPLGVRETIQTASVLGREFELPLLQRMARDNNLLPQHIAEAERAEVWAPSDDLHYIFSQGLLRDAAYEMQMQSRRRELHALALEALENLYGEVKSRYAELAYHAKYAGLASRAQRYYRLAGEIAAESYQNHQAIEYYKRALAFTPLNDLKTQYDILIDRVELFNRIGNRPAQLKDLQTLERVALQLNDQQRLAKVKVSYAKYYFIVGNYSSTIKTSEQVIAIAREIGDADLSLGVYVIWSHALFRSGNPEEAMRHAMDGLSLARRAGKRVEEGKSLSSLGLIALEYKDPGLAQGYLEEALVIARETKERTLESRSLQNLANAAAYVQRDYLRARAYYEQAYALSVELGDRYGQGLCLGNIGWVCGMLGEFSVAQKCHVQALSIAREIGHFFHEAYTLMNLSGLAEAQGNAQEAVQYAEQANVICKEKGDKPSEAWSCLYLGYAYTLAGQLQFAQTAFERARNLRRELGQQALGIEAISGLIRVSLEMNDLALSSQLVEEVILYFLEGGTLEGTEEPLKVYLACYLVLERIGDPRAFDILQTAMQLLQAQVSKISEESRRSYIGNIPWRRAIEQAWSTKVEQL